MELQGHGEGLFCQKACIVKHHKLEFKSWWILFPLLFRNDFVLVVLLLGWGTTNTWSGLHNKNTWLPLGKRHGLKIHIFIMFTTCYNNASRREPSRLSSPMCLGLYCRHVMALPSSLCVCVCGSASVPADTIKGLSLGSGKHDQDILFWRKYHLYHIHCSKPVKEAADQSVVGSEWIG